MNLWQTPPSYDLAMARTGRTGAAANGTTNTCIRRFTNLGHQGSSVTVTDDAAKGTYFSILQSGWYEIKRIDSNLTSGGNAIGISVHSSISATATLTTGIQNISGWYENNQYPPFTTVGWGSNAQRVSFLHNSAANFFMVQTSRVWIPAGLFVFPHDGAAGSADSNVGKEMMIVKRVW